MRLPAAHFRHLVTIYRPDASQRIDPDFGEVDGDVPYVPVGTFRAYVRLYTDHERVIDRTGEQLSGDGTAAFRPDDLGQMRPRNGDRLLIAGEAAYEIHSVTARAPQAGEYAVIVAAFRRVRIAPQASAAAIGGVLTVAAG